MDRRTFLKTFGMGSIAFAAGCSSEPEKNLFSLIKAPDDMITGKATWYASTCRECPAGCGVIAKNREGRIIKLEGNPNHPVNKGKLCIRGQSALQAVYDPDRIKKPLLKQGTGWSEISYEKAISLIRGKCSTAASKGPNRVRMLTEISGESLLSVFNLAMSNLRSSPPVIFEPFAFESMKLAHKYIFGAEILPTYRLDESDFLLNFGADFLETWLSPVEYASKFKLMHGFKNGKKGVYIHVSPYMSLTGANADKYISCIPGREPFVALYLIRELIESGRGKHLRGKFRKDFIKSSEKHLIGNIEDLTGIGPENLKIIFKNLTRSEKPIVLGSASAPSGPVSEATDILAALMNFILDKDLSLYDFQNSHRIEAASTRREVLSFIEKTNNNETDVLFINNSNPVFTLPDSEAIEKAIINDETFTVCFTSFMDETAEKSDLIFPVQLPLESWDTYESKKSIVSSMQPAMGKLSEAPSVGDVFMALASKRPSVNTYKSYLIESQISKNRRGEAFNWLKMLQQGGKFDAIGGKYIHSPELSPDLIGIIDKALEESLKVLESKTTFMAVPSIKFFDGRGANKPWLNEIPETISQISWGAASLMHPQTLKKKGYKSEDILIFKSNSKEIKAPVYSYKGVHPNTVIMPVGLGHKQYGRFAQNNGENPVKLLNGSSLDIPSYITQLTSITGTGEKITFANTDGDKFQYGRKIALTVSIEKAEKKTRNKSGLGMHDFPLTLPIPEDYNRKRDIYPPHDHDKHRWGMIVDLDRCIGCGSCVAGCYAENNIGVVGEKRVIEGREMAWLRIERYHDEKDLNKLIFFPMMCQHCDNAPCESVCPVYAPHHSKEGLNNQIYNRCIGTRFCAQNCPYKVRRFNWFEYTWPEPLDLQLNPNVTVRCKGVMEKCSFCIQRIKEAHWKAKDEKREVEDGDITPACAQTCPTDAIVFGDFMDPRSRVRKLADDPRAYQAMGYLNTKPAVIYLKKVDQNI